MWSLFSAMAASTEFTENCSQSSPDAVPGWSGPIVFIDAECVLCNGSALFLATIDRRAKLRFAALGSDLARKLIPRGSTEGSVLLFLGDRVLSRSAAVIECLVIVGGIWGMAAVFRFVPAVLRDGIYEFIARSRYRLFGRKDACSLPDSRLRERFLTD
jgi:predicted DCC family thiol-disulfide oxidoreductase YuxK